MLKLITTLLCICFMFVAGVSHADELLRQRIEGWRAGYPALIGERAIANRERLATFYEENQYRPLWLNNGRLNRSAEHLLEAIEGSAAEGLLPEDYHRRYLVPGFLEEPLLVSAEYDILLTDAFLSLAQHLLAGKVNPETLTPEWKTNKRKLNPSEVLSRVKSEEDLPQILNSLRPNQPRYRRLTAALVRLQRHADVNWEPLRLNGVIKPGTSDSRVPALAERLVFWGDLAEPVSSDTYDEHLVLAVKRFQARHGLEADGVIGPETIKALNVSVAQRIRELTVNLERWRWLEDFGNRFLVVNIAAFDLRIYENDEKIFQRPVIVGKEYRKTPVFSDVIRHIVFNPTWTVPHRLAVQDKLPEIKRDMNYLSRLGFTLYNIGTSEVVDPQAIDWNALSGKKFPFRMVQSPGPLNALGQVKFMFPNPWDVYLHDTPSRDLFKKSDRAFSSGCIRVADPMVLAEVLLGPKWDTKRISGVLDSGKTTTAFLEKPMPVHIEYWTAWVDSDERLHFRKDIYGRDGPLWAALTQPL